VVASPFPARSRSNALGVCRAKRMFARLLVTIVLIPVVLGIIAAGSRRVRNRFLYLLALVAVFDVLYLFLMYYLRYRWVGG
jgi:hypothetical protein